MKAIYTLIVLTIVLGLTGCSASDDETMELASGFDAVKATYGLEETVAAAESGTPSVTLEEMQGVLESLYSGSNIQRECVAVASYNEDKSAFKLPMSGSYRTLTRSGVSEEGFSLNVELKFSIEDGQVYYWGTDYTYSSNLFEWRANGLSLASVKGMDYTYEFESKSYLYFKVVDEGARVVRVPVIFGGNYNFETGKGTYHFQITRYGK